MHWKETVDLVPTNANVNTNANKNANTKIKAQVKALLMTCAMQSEYTNAPMTLFSLVNIQSAAITWWIGL